MIVFDLECREGAHRFEGWFGSSENFARQQEDGLLICPVCGSTEVTKAVMAPNVGRKGNQAPLAAAKSAPAAGQQATAMTAGPEAPSLPPQALEMLRKIAQVQAEALKSSRWVGDRFAENARAMHYGEKDAEAIHGKASKDDVAALIEEGVEIAPVLFPVVPPEETN